MNQYKILTDGGKGLFAERLNQLYDEVKRIHAVRYPYNNFLY